MQNIFVEFKLQPSYSCRTLYLNLINDQEKILQDIQTLSQHLQCVLNHETIILPSLNAKPITRATKEAIQERITELQGEPIKFKTTQLASETSDHRMAQDELLQSLEGLAIHLEPIGVKVMRPGCIIIDDVGILYYDEYCRITKTNPDLELNGKNALEFIAGLCAQDFGLVIERDEELIYLYGSARFEKTPKHIENGFDYFVGSNFLEWHRRIPIWGPSLAPFFAQIYASFKQNKLDSFVVDLKGRNLYTDGEFILHRIERDYTLPLKTPTGKTIGLIVFADSLYKKIDDTVFGGQHLLINSPATFHQKYQVIKNISFRHHPFGMRDQHGKLPFPPKQCS